jgi:hypothetical protein
LGQNQLKSIEAQARLGRVNPRLLQGVKDFHGESAQIRTLNPIDHGLLEIEIPTLIVDRA